MHHIKDRRKAAEMSRLVVGIDDDSFSTAALQLGDDVRQHRSITDGNQRLGHLIGERPEASPKAGA
jgi:hypothetical protein